jgi:DNA-directed RNA polymerase specialized sigma24 family protein
MQVIVAGKTSREPLSPSEPPAVGERLSAGDIAGAVRVAIETHGAELFGFLIGVLENEELARVVYADVCQRAASEIDSFGRQCSLRIWLYALSRRELRDRRLRRKRAPEDTGRQVGASADTDSRRPAGLTGAIDAVRRALSEEERELLILRIDRGFELDDLAMTEIGPDAAPFARASEREVLRARLDELLERVERLTVQHVRAR